MKDSEAVEAGLHCPRRRKHSVFLTSTPDASLVCEDDNLECWEDGRTNASLIAPPAAFLMTLVTTI